MQRAPRTAHLLLGTLVASSLWQSLACSEQETTDTRAQSVTTSAPRAPGQKTSSPTTKAASSAHLEGNACPRFREAKVTGKVTSSDVDEASGLAASRMTPGLLWVHNDSGDSARVFALDAQGKMRSTYSLPTVRAKDWEDMAIGPKPGARGDYLYFGDIGDNTGRRSDGVVIHRVPEPAVALEGPANDREGPLQGLESFRLRYPDGPRDAETLLVDPKTGEVVIVTKVMFGAPRIYFAGPKLAPEGMLSGGEPLDFDRAGIEDGLFATSGDVSPDGRFVVVRGYGNAYLWQRDPARPLHEAFASRACRVPLAAEPQGEAIAFAADGSGYFTLSEKAEQPLYFFARN